MSIVLTLKYNGNLYIAGDSISTNGTTRNTTKTPKVFESHQVKGVYLGATGSWRLVQLLKHDDIFDEYLVEKFNDPEYVLNERDLVLHVIPKYKALLDTFADKTGADTGLEGNMFMITHKNNAWRVQGDFAVLSDNKDFDGIGWSSKAEAILEYALLYDKDIEPVQLLTRALDIVSGTTQGVCGPYNIINTTTGEVFQ